MAKRVSFLRDYDLEQGPRQVVAYKRGYEATLPDAQADEAVSRGAAEVLEDKTPSKRAKGSENGKSTRRSKG